MLLTECLKELIDVILRLYTWCVLYRVAQNRDKFDRTDFSVMKNRMRKHCFISKCVWCARPFWWTTVQRIRDDVTFSPRLAAQCTSIDWLRGTSPNWPILCGVWRKRVIQSINHTQSPKKALFVAVLAEHGRPLFLARPLMSTFCNNLPKFVLCHIYKEIDIAVVEKSGASLVAML